MKTVYIKILIKFKVLKFILITYQKVIDSC